MSPESTDPKLVEAVRRTGKCQAFWIGSAQIKEVFEGDTIWEGDVHVYRLFDNLYTDQCYAWHYENDGGEKEYATVLAVPPVNSPEAAVRVFIDSRI